jgi:hypothetical protein
MSYEFNLKIAVNRTNFISISIAEPLKIPGVPNLKYKATTSSI